MASPERKGNKRTIRSSLRLDNHGLPNHLIHVDLFTVSIKHNLMKKTILITTLATAGLAMLPVYADHHGAKPAVEEQQADNATVSVYIVQTSGKG